jgi:hypothetical protein
LEETVVRKPNDREEGLMRLLNFETLQELEKWLNAPSDLPLAEQLNGTEPEAETLTELREDMREAASPESEPQD